MAMIAAVGFAPGVIKPLLNGKIPRDVIIHVHVAVYSVWLLLFFAQCVYAAIGKVSVHRKLGKILIGYAVLMFLAGVGVTTNRFVSQVRAGNPRAAQIMNLAPMIDMLAFPVFFGLAISYRRKPEIHKRLMIVTATLILYPAVTRISFPRFMGSFVVFMIVWTSPVLIGMAHDWIKRRVIHPAYVFGILTLGVLGLRPMVLASHLWIRLSGWLISLI
jgi:hypothetical protein